MDIDGELFHLHFWGYLLDGKLSAHGKTLHDEYSDHQVSGHCECRHFARASGIAGVFFDVG